MSYILIIILAVIAFSQISNLKFRLTVLEKKLIKSEPLAPPVQSGVPINQVAANSADTVVTPVENVVYGPTAGDKFVTWFKEDWLLKLGALLLLIGLGWFTTYAFMNNWIGEFGRITLGMIFGVAVLALGSWRIRKYINQGGIFLVVGSAIILLTVFAAREIYDMFTPLFALIVMFLSTAYISLISVKYDSFAVSLSGLVLALIAPLLTNSATVNEFGLFSYLFVVTLGAIWIVIIKKNWGSLIFSSLVGVFLYSLSIHSDSLIWFIYGFAAVFFLASIINIINSKESDIKAFLWTAVGNGAILLFSIINLVPAEWQSSIIALWMLIFAVGAFLSFSVTKIKSVFLVYAGVAIVMLLVATAIELSGSVMIIVFTLESLLIPVLIYYVTKNVRASAIWSLLFIWPTFLSFGSLSYYQSSMNIFSKDFFVVFLLIVALISLGLMFRKIKKAGEYSDFNPANVFLIGGSIYAYILLWSALHVGIKQDVVATTFSLVIFTIIALVKYFYGISVGSKILRNYGGALIAFVILRLLFIDIWQMEMGARIFVFVLIGILLMSTAFISRRIKSGTLISQ